MAGMEMEFRLLGRLAVCYGGLELPVRQGKQRALLAGLLLRANRTVLMRELAETLWGAEPPPSAEMTIRNHVRRLRDALGAAGRARVATVPGGYLVNVAVGELDVSRFESLLMSAHTAARGDSWEQAAGQARAALALWRGDPLEDVPSDVLVLQEVPRLAELRLQALETRIDADLHLGRHTDVIAELQGLIQAHPLREHLRAQLMVGLYRCGRQAEALAAYQQTRHTLVEEIGAEPGPELYELHEQILSADPALALPRPAPAPEPARPQITPRQLPSPVRDFVGRKAALAALAALIGPDLETAPATVVVLAIGGTAGVGKTTLAVHWAHHVADRFPDGQLYVNLRGFDPAGAPVAPAQAIQDFLEALGVPPDRIPGSIEAQAGLYRSVLAGKRVLIVLDNARDVSQVRPLLPGGTGCLTLVTSRGQLAGLLAAEAAVPITLDVLTADEAWEFLRRRLGSERVLGEPGAAARLIEASARLPLALSMVAARAAQRPRSPLAALVAELQDAGRRLDCLDAGDGVTSVRAALSWSYQQLGDLAARLFRLLSVHPGPDISAAAAAGVAGLPVAHARQALDELSRAHLMAEPSAGRFACHDLLRVYAAELAAGHDSQPERRAASHRMVDHYLHTAYAASLALYPARDRMAFAAPQPGAQPEQITGSRAALAWLSAEHRVLLRVIALAAETGFDAYAQWLPDVLATHLDRSARWQDCVTVQQLSLAAAERRSDQRGRARAHRFLGRALIRLDRYQDGLSHLREAMELFRDLGDRLGEARSHLAIAMALEGEGQLADALRHAEEAVPLFRGIGHRAGLAAALTAVGGYQCTLGAHRQAVAHCEQALDLLRELGNRDGEAASWGVLGRAYHGLGQLTDAISSYRRALDQLATLGHAYNQSTVLTHLGDAYQAAGNHAAARRCWQQALRILHDLHHPGAAEVRARLGGLQRPGSMLPSGRTASPSR